MCALCHSAQQHSSRCPTTTSIATTARNRTESDVDARWLTRHQQTAAPPTCFGRDGCCRVVCGSHEHAHANANAHDTFGVATRNVSVQTVGQSWAGLSIVFVFVCSMAGKSNNKCGTQRGYDTSRLAAREYMTGAHIQLGTHSDTRTHIYGGRECGRTERESLIRLLAKITEILNV